MDDLKVEPGKWVPCRIESHGKAAVIALDGHPIYRQEVDAPGRNGFGLYVQGRDAELRVKDLKLEIMPK
jgi:hypothetical protein